MVEPIIFGQYNGQKIELGVKVYLNQLGIHGGPPGASKIAPKIGKNWLCKGENEWHGMEFIEKLYLEADHLIRHKTWGVTPYGKQIWAPCGVSKNAWLGQKKCLF